MALNFRELLDENGDLDFEVARNTANEMAAEYIRLKEFFNAAAKAQGVEPLTKRRVNVKKADTE